MAVIKKTLALFTCLAVLVGAALWYWASSPIFDGAAPIPFTVAPGSGAGMSTQQIVAAGVPVNPMLLSMLTRATRSSARIKAGSYELKPGASPLDLIDQLVRGDFAQASVTIIEGWSFRQMRQALAQNMALKHDTADLSDQQLMARISPDFTHAEGLFFPDTYLFAKGSSELQVYKRAHATLIERLNAHWNKRATALPYRNAYQALIMASIIEKETGKESERAMIAGVFVNRLRLGMLLQTDPSVIYGMGAKYLGKIYKRDLETDTAYNTYTRAGLPPTPIALPGEQSLSAAFAPASTNALYFVARGDGSSKFSANLQDHNRAVNQYQR